MILDTNAVSALADGDSSLVTILKKQQKHHLPVIVLGEYRYGLRNSRERSARERWLFELESHFDVLDITSYTSQHYAIVRDQLKQNGKPIPENDVWIGALAREHGLEVVSRDNHFDYIDEIVRITW